MRVNKPPAAIATIAKGTHEFIHEFIHGFHSFTRLTQVTLLISKLSILFYYSVVLAIGAGGGRRDGSPVAQLPSWWTVFLYTVSTVSFML